MTSWTLLAADDVILLHEIAIQRGGLKGKARDRSLEAALARVENRLRYGMIRDVFDLAAAYAIAIATAHCFNDANKRTAFLSMLICLELNGAKLGLETEETGRLIIDAAQGRIDGSELAGILRKRAGPP